MASGRALAVGAGVALVAYLAWAYRSQAPTVTLPDTAFGQSWTPYSHFEHRQPGVTLRHFPQTTCATVLPLAIQNESAGFALERLEVDSASYAQ